MENLLDLGNTTGKMEVILKENLKMVLEMVKVYGKEELETVIDMKVNMKMIKNQVTEFLHGVQAMCIKETIRMMLEMAMARCIGTMVVFTKENGKVEFSMVKVNIIFYLG